MRVAEIFRSIQGEGLLTGVESIFVRTSGCNLRCGYCDTPYASWKPEGEDLSIADVLERIEQLRDTEPPEFLEPHISPRSSREGQGATAVGGREGIHGECSSSNPQSRIPNPSDDDMHHVVLTGGEPMLFAEVEPLSNQLQDEGWHITIETSGTRYLPVACNLMSISPKLSNSTPSEDAVWAARHRQERHAPEVVRRLIAEYDYQIKFVVGCAEDCREIEAYLIEFPAIRHDRVLLMPLGVATVELAARAAWIEPYCREQGFRFCPRRHIEWFGPARGR